jgi:hypothetical protein
MGDLPEICQRRRHAAPTRAHDADLNGAAAHRTAHRSASNLRFRSPISAFQTGQPVQRPDDFFHVHLVAFQLISRDRYETGGFDGAADTQATATFSGPGTIDEDESG